MKFFVKYTSEIHDRLKSFSKIFQNDKNKDEARILSLYQTIVL